MSDTPGAPGKEDGMGWDGMGWDGMGWDGLFPDTGTSQGALVVPGLHSLEISPLRYAGSAALTPCVTHQSSPPWCLQSPKHILQDLIILMRSGQVPRAVREPGRGRGEGEEEKMNALGAEEPNCFRYCV